MNTIHVSRITLLEFVYDVMDRNTQDKISMDELRAHDNLNKVADGMECDPVKFSDSPFPAETVKKDYGSKKN